MQFLKILNISFEKISHIAIFMIFFIKVSLNWDVSSTRLKLFTGNVGESPSIQITYVSILTIWWFFIFIMFFMYLLLAFTQWWIAWHISPLIPYSKINNILIKRKRSNFTWTFFNAIYPTREEGPHRAFCWFFDHCI